MGFFDKLKQGLSKTKTSFEEKINNVFSNFRKVDEELLEELEEARRGTYYVRCWSRNFNKNNRKFKR